MPRGRGERHRAGTDKLLSPDDAPAPEDSYLHGLGHRAVSVTLMALRDRKSVQRNTAASCGHGQA